ncbi:hypothetical protein [Nocardiopsis sp. CC223A]|uniref:hypothetical protein n=1 Tax=Nocardiopsis sp. CC223A TaxID=3044051 RepID=UPI00278BF83E|nr:hypothetical protein [Nocardiopsis sp. CC223A]
MTESTETTTPEPVSAEPPTAEEPVAAGGPAGEDGGPGAVAAADTADGAEGAATGRGGPWGARTVLVAAAGLVVGGTAYLGVEVADAFAPAATAEVTETEPEQGTGERRTTSLLADPEESAPQETVADSAVGGDTTAPAQGPVGPPAEGTAPAGGGGDGTSDGEDPREQILDDILNTPQERPPLVNDCDQACVDAHTAREEEDVEPVVVEFHPEDYEFPTAP